MNELREGNFFDNNIAPNEIIGYFNRLVKEGSTLQYWNIYFHVGSEEISKLIQAASFYEAYKIGKEMYNEYHKKSDFFLDHEVLNWHLENTYVNIGLTRQENIQNLINIIVDSDGSIICKLFERTKSEPEI